MSTPSPPAVSKNNATRYIVPMFPYPSGRLHIGHVRNYAIADSMARHHRRQGDSVMFPIGWDAFGLPAENAARENGVDPRAWTEHNIGVMRAQLQALNFSFDWALERATCDPDFIHRGQRLFLDLQGHGWIERRMGTVWWDPVDETVLANEQVIDGRGWRSGALVEQRQMAMLFARTACRARQLDAGLDHVDWPVAAKNAQKAWIGWDEDTETCRLHDWCLSRQRSWGTPVPLADCADCGEVHARADELPWLPLPTRPTAADRACMCSRCGGPALRCVETLDTFWDSSFYFLVYPDTHPMTHKPLNDATLAPVGLYIGGLEHATMHLLYARWMMLALADVGYGVPEEPFRKLIGQGMVCGPAFRQGEDGNGGWVDACEVQQRGSGWVDAQGAPVRFMGAQKMSKSKKNGVDPQILIERFGADAVRWALLFAGPFAQDIVWEEATVATAQKHLNRLETIAHTVAGASDERENKALLQHAMALQAKVTSIYEQGDGIHALMGEALGVLRLVRRAALAGAGEAARLGFDAVLDVLGPVCPDTCERAASIAGRPGAVRRVPVEATTKVPDEPFNATVRVHIDGKRRGSVAVEPSDTADIVWARFSAAEPEVVARHAPEGTSSIVWKPGVFINAVKRKPKST